MQEAWTEFETRGNPPDIADTLTNLLQHPLVRLVHLDICQKGKIVSLVRPAEMRLEITRQRGPTVHLFRQYNRILLVREQLDPILLKNGYLRGQRTGFLIFVCELSRRDLAALYVRLIEWVDVENRTCHCRGELPAEKLLSEIVRIVYSNANHWLAGSFQFVYRRVLRVVRCCGQSQIDE